MAAAIWRWLARLFFFRKDHPGRRNARWPTLDEIARLPSFDALESDRIVEVSGPDAARRACRELEDAGVAGFDTESKPTFLKGEVSTGPHVAQFATADRTYVFILHDPECRKAAGGLIGSASLKKVGFGLSGDLRQIRAKLGVEPRNVLDLESLFAERGHGRGVGVKVGVAITLKRRFSKSRKMRTSNWMRRRLSDSQIRYAANDAFAALRVFQTLTAPKGSPNR